MSCGKRRVRRKDGTVFMRRKSGKKLWEWDHLKDRVYWCLGEDFFRLSLSHAICFLTNSLNYKSSFTASLVPSAPQNNSEVEDKHRDLRDRQGATFTSAPRILHSPQSFQESHTRFHFYHIHGWVFSEGGPLSICFLKFIWKWKMKLEGSGTPVSLNHNTIQVLVGTSIRLVSDHTGWPVSST